MILNNTSYVHVTIRKLCLQLELLSGMKLVTDFDEEFNEIRFVDSLGYIVIDYRRNAVISLSHRLTKKEQLTTEDIMLYCQWLEIGKKWQNKRNKNVTIRKRQQRVRKARKP